MDQGDRVLALVTGANGFVGCHLVHHLLRQGYRVRALVRTTSDLTSLEGLDVEFAFGDVTSPDTLPPALRGAGVVFHVAGLTKSRDSGAYFRVNRDGTRALAEACLAEGGLRRLVYISSQAAAGPSTDLRPLNETDTPAPIGPYGASKLAGEQAAFEVAADRLPATIVRPAIVYGPWERDMLQLFLMARRGIVPRVLGDSCVSLIHAADLADLIERAGRLPSAAGKIYHAADPEPAWMGRIIRIISSALGRRVIQVPVPPALLWPFALVNEQFLKMGKGIEALTLSRLKEFRERFWVLDVSRALDELEWSPARSLHEGIEETGAWYREKGWIRR